MDHEMPSPAAPAAERSWWKLGSGGWRTALKNTAGQFKEDDVASLAAVVTLRLVLALVPSLIAGVAIATTLITPEQIEELVRSAGGVVPADSRDFVIDTLQGIVDQRSGGIAAAGIATGLIAASGAAAALMGALNAAYDVEETRGFVQKRLISLAIVGALVVVLAGMFVVLVFGPTLVALVLPDVIVESPLQLLIALGRYLLAVVLLMAFFGFAFRVGPDKAEPRWRLLTPGAVLGVGGWLLLSFLFSLYVRTFGNYSAYGAAAGVFILLIWLNYSFIVLLMGAELDNEIEKLLIARGASPTPLPSAVHPDDLQGTGLDAVTPDMPRHPGLVAAGGSARGARSTGSGDAGATGRATGGPPAGPAGPRLPTPRLLGAARRTAGAQLAARLWARGRA